MVIHHDTESVLWRIDKYFKLKPSMIGDPDIYLGDKLKKMRLENGVWAWAKIPASYVKESVSNVEKYLAELADARWQLPKKKAKNPFIGDYGPEMDNTPALEHDIASWYQYLIGMLRWTVEIGRVDIITEVSMMAAHMAMPREGHLEVVLHVFELLRQKYNSRMAFDPIYSIINMNEFKEWKWKDFYGDLKEAIPPNAPEERGKEVDLRGYDDSDHAT